MSLDDEPSWLTELRLENKMLTVIDLERSEWALQPQLNELGALNGGTEQ